MNKEVSPTTKENFAFNVIKSAFGVAAYEKSKSGYKPLAVQEAVFQFLMPGTNEIMIEKIDLPTKKFALRLLLMLVETGISVTIIRTAFEYNLTILAAKPVYNVGVATIIESVRTIRNRKSAKNTP